MSETNGGGEVQSEHDRYLQRVGADVNTELRNGIVPRPVRLDSDDLAEYFSVQDEWVTACHEAAEAEVAYSTLMGRPSYLSNQQLGPTTWSVVNKPMRDYSDKDLYGQTKPAKLASKKEEALLRQAQRLGNSLVVESNDDTYRAMWRSLLSSGQEARPSNRDILKYAQLGAVLLEAARAEEGQPLVMMRTRQGGKSWLYTADDFKLVPEQNGVVIQLDNAQESAYEVYGSHHYGGRSGMIGGGHWESRWTEVKNPTVQSGDILDGGLVVSDHEVKLSVDRSFPTLHGLLDNTLYDLADYISQISSYASDKIQSQTIIVVGAAIEGLREAVEQTHPPEFGKGLKAAIKCISEARQQEVHNQLMQQVAASDADYFA